MNANSSRAASGGAQQPAPGVTADAVSRALAAWRALAPPLRPSAENIAALARLSDGATGGGILVLGATPEVVDLVVDLPASRRVTMDWDAANVQAMRLLARRDWSGVETQIGDWREPVSGWAGAFRLVLGDGSFAMLSFPDDWRSVCGQLHRYLEPGGRLIVRTLFRSDAIPDGLTCCREACRRFDEAVARAPGQRDGLFRELLAELRLTVVMTSVEPSGSISAARRMDTTRRVKAELKARYGDWADWGVVDLAIPEPASPGVVVGRARGVPSWEEAVRLLDETGFVASHKEQACDGPASAAMHTFVAVRRPT